MLVFPPCIALLIVSFLLYTISRCMVEPQFLCVHSWSESSNVCCTHSETTFKENGRRSIEIFCQRKALYLAYDIVISGRLLMVSCLVSLHRNQ
jgi:hypothetical protein